MTAGRAEGTLTARNDPAIDAYVGGLLGRVVDAVVARLGHELRAMVLAGGFGRGEGGVLRRPDGSLHIVNDFDIELVYREPLGPAASKLWVQLRHRRAIQALAEELARAFGMKQVDLTLRGESSLRRRSGKLADYDLLHGHRLLWGSDDPCANMPALASSDIAPFEATWLLRNRGIGLVLARLYLDRDKLHSEDRENFYIEVNKAVLAMGDALWILAGRYTVKYADRAAGFESLAAMGFPAMEELKAHYRQAAEYKLRPVAIQYPGVEPEALWQGTVRLYCRFFLWFESCRLKQSIADMRAYAAWVDVQPAAGGDSWVRRWLDRHVGAAGDCPASLRPLKYQPARSVLFVAALLASRQGDVAAQRVLEAWPVPGSRALAWATQGRGLLSLLHPGGEVGRFLHATALEPSPQVAGVAA